MQIPIVNSTTFMGTEHTKSDKAKDSAAADWSTALERVVEFQADQSSVLQAAAPPDPTSVKLSELLVAHALREIMPSGGTKEGGLAHDTWRGMLADAIAKEVAPHIRAMPLRDSTTEAAR